MPRYVRLRRRRILRLLEKVMLHHICIILSLKYICQSRYQDTVSYSKRACYKHTVFKMVWRCNNYNIYSLAFDITLKEITCKSITAKRFPHRKLRKKLFLIIHIKEASMAHQSVAHICILKPAVAYD